MSWVLLGNPSRRCLRARLEAGSLQLDGSQWAESKAWAMLAGAREDSDDLFLAQLAEELQQSSDPSSHLDRVAARLGTMPKMAPDELESVIAWYASSPEPIWRSSIASWPHTPSWILNWLTRDPEEAVALAAGRHPNCPAQALAHFARGHSVRQMVVAAEHPSTPPKLLSELAEVTTDWIQYHMAGNPSLPLSALRKLAASASEPVAQRARQALAERDSADLGI